MIWFFLNLMKFLSLYSALAIDQLPLSLEIEGSDLEVVTATFFIVIIFAHHKYFLSSDDVSHGAIFTCAGPSFALI